MKEIIFDLRSEILGYEKSWVKVKKIGFPIAISMQSPERADRGPANLVNYHVIMSAIHVTFLIG